MIVSVIPYQPSFAALYSFAHPSTNPLVKAADEYVKAGKTPVSWNFTTMPSEEWKNQVGSAMLEYAQGTGEWDAVKTAFVDGWEKSTKQQMKADKV